MFTLSPLLAGAAAVALTPLVAALPEPIGAHNPNHPVRQLAARRIINDASSISGQNFDFIIAGGGLAGLAVAGRLSEWSNQTVLVIEAGPDGTQYEDQINTPGFSYLNSLTGSEMDWAYRTVPQTDANNLQKSWPRGKGLGGSGAINGMYWNRGNRENYDAWNTLNPGATEDWGWDEMDRCIMKAENWTAARADQVSQHGMALDPNSHGQEGPIQAGFAQYMFDIVENWTPSLRAVGMNPIDGGSGTTHGSYFCPLTLNPSNMTRSDSKAGYIDPLPPRDNLVILTGQQVTAITFNGTTDSNGNVVASGVSFQASAGAQSYTVNANREVILSGGTVGSPQILQLSGIGPQSQLAALGIESRIDIPVGYNLQDHITATVEFSTPQGTLTWNNLSNDQTLKAAQLAQYQADGTGMWTFVNQGVAFPNMADLLGGSAADYAATVLEDLNQTWTDVVGWKSLPDNVARGLSAQYQVQQSHIDSEVGQVEMLLHLLAPNNGIAVQASLQHPWSRGTIFITSTDPFTAPAIDPDYFSVGYDIDILQYGVQFARRIAGAAPLNTVAITEANPGVSIADGEALNDWIRNDIGTTYHPIGTCSMLPRDQGGVVDTNLLVYGSANIRVIDSSIIPLHMSAHTMGTTYGVAEKGAEIIKKRYWEVQPDTASSSSGGSSATNSGSRSSATPSSTDGAAAGGAGTTTNGGLSNAAKIGVGVGAGVGAAALLAAIIAFCCIRRKKQRSAPTDAAWYQNNQGSGPEYDQVPKERDSEYPMANFTAPAAAFGHNGRTPSVSTMATADLASRDPMMADRRASSGFGFDNYGYDHSGQATPAERFDDAGYPTTTPAGAWSPAHQQYTQVQI